MSESATTTERLTLSREFSELLVDLSIALHKHAMYPHHHPSLGPAADAVVRRAHKLLEGRERIALGVARDQLIIEGVATDPRQPVLRRLAEGLHRHHLGAVSIMRGILADEITEALRALASEAERDGPLGLLPPDRLPAWPHLKLHPLTFDRLALVADAPVTPGSGPAAGGARDGSRGAELWLGLARAAMAGDAGVPAAAVPAEPAVVARAIDDHPKAEAYDQVIVGYLLQIAGELNRSSGSEAAALRRRTGRLIAALKPETLRRLVEMGGDNAQRREFVLHAAHGMAVDAVIEILKAAADASGQTISHGLVRMLSKLAAHAEAGPEEARPLADSALREQVSRLLDGWQLADPNPEGYGRLLQHVATRGADAKERAAEPADRPDPLRLVQMSLETAATGPLVDRAIVRAIRERQAGALVGLLHGLPPGAGDAGQAVFARLLDPDAVRAMTAAEPVDFEALDRLVPLMSSDAHGALLDALASAESRATRRRLLERLSAPDLEIAALVASRLDDERWFVQRNMLVLLTRIGRVPEGFSPRPWTTHPDARVRHEALRLQLVLPEERDVALQAALGDDDPRIVHLGLAALRDGFPAVLEPLVAAAALQPDLEERLRLLAIRALGLAPRGAACLRALLALVDGGRTILGRAKLAPRSPVVVAALRALADGWSGHEAAAPVLAIAAASPDPEIRGAARPRLP